MTKTHAGLVALFGPPNVGKSTLLNALIGQKIAPTTHKPGTTRRICRGILTKDNCQFVFVDTPGIFANENTLLGTMKREAVAALQEVDVVVFVADLTQYGVQHRFVEEALKICSQECKKHNRPLLLVLNKIDVVKEKAAMLPILQDWSKKADFSAVIPISARKEIGLDGLLKELAERLPEAPFMFDPESVTDLSERELVADLIREKAMLELDNELPYQIAIMIEDFDEARREDKKKPLVEISAVICVERESQKGIVVGKGGTKIKAIGMRARQELERFLGCQVMLNLVVKVEPDWTRSKQGLRRVGH